MTTVAGSIAVELNGKDVGLSELLRRIDSEAQKSADSALRLSQQYARLASAQGQPALGGRVLAGAMQNVTGASERATIAVQTQISTLRGGAGIADQFGGALKSSLLGIVGPAALATAAIGAVKGAADLTIAGESANKTTQAFNQLALQAGTTGDAILGALRKASSGEINDLNLKLAANRANLLGVADSAGEFGQLMDIARDRAQKMGITTTQAFDNLVTGLGRGSALILDNLGIIVKEGEVNEAYAKSVGKTVAQLSDQEKKQALINAVLAQGQAGLQAGADGADKQANAYARLGTAIENAKDKLGSFLSTQTQGTAGATADLLGGLTGTLAGEESRAGFEAAAGGAQNLVRALSGIPPANAQAQASQRAWAGAIGEWLGLTQQEIVATNAFGGAITTQTQGMLGTIAGYAQATAAAQLHAATMEDDALKSLIAAANSDELSAAKARLQQQAQLAAQAVIVGGGNIAATANRLAASSSQVDVLTAAYLRLAAAQGTAILQAQQAANVRSNLGPGGLVAGAPGVSSGANNDINEVLRLQRSGLLGGGAAPARRALDDGSTVGANFGRGFAAGVRNTVPPSLIDNALSSPLLKSKGRGGGGGGGGGGALSDQTKLNNDLAGQQLQADQQAENAASQHSKKLLDIEQQYADRMKKAEDALQQDQADSRASFYDKITQIKDPKLAQQLSAQYEQAAAEAGQIAAAQGADVAQKYLDAQQAALTAQAGRAQAIGEAQGKGDTSEVARLQAVDKLYRDAEARKVEAAKKGDGSIAAERQKALGDEADNYAAQQDKIASKADQAADRTVAAAERRGSAIDAEQTKLDTLGKSYDRVGGPRGAPGTATTAGATPTASAPAATAASGGDPLVGALNAARDAIVSAVAAVERATKDTTGAVRSLKGSGVLNGG